MSTTIASALQVDDIFNFDDADMTLRSSDGVQFAVHRCILRRISPFFADMLSLPQPGRTVDTRNSIDMAEDATSLRILLGICYPRTFSLEPKLANVIDIKRAAAVARKFDSAAINVAVVHALSVYSRHKPEVAYAISWKYEFKEALRVAARASFDHGPFLNDTWDMSDFEDVPATALAQLYRYHAAIPIVIESLCNPEALIEWISLSDTELTSPECSDTRLILKFHDGEDDNGGLTLASVMEWWWKFVTDTIAALRSPSRPQLHVAFDQAFQNVMAEGGPAGVCSTSRAGSRWYAVMQTTRNKLHQEIERRISEIPLVTPF